MAKNTPPAADHLLPWTRRQFLQVGLAATSTAILPACAAATTPCHTGEQGWTLAKLQAHVQAALELELFTIPPYLTALYSIKDPGSEAYLLIRSVVIEEMLHLQLACNLLLAIGGSPRLTAKAAPQYPDPIPGIAPTYYIKLARASTPQMQAFMAIETPTYTLSKAQTRFGPQPSYATIGEFYDAVRHGIHCLGESIFTGVRPIQVSSYGSNDIIITDVASAFEAINVITSQGEGAQKKPHHDLDQIDGHYWRFKKLFEDKTDPFSADKVYPMADDPGQQNLSPKLAALARFSDDAYVWLLQALERGFNGDPQGVGKTVGGLMYQVIQPLSVYLMQQKLSKGGTATLGPSFQYNNVVSLADLQQDWQRLDKTYRRDPTLIAVAKVLGLNTTRGKS